MTDVAEVALFNCEVVDTEAEGHIARDVAEEAGGAGLDVAPTNSQQCEATTMRRSGVRQALHRLHNVDKCANAQARPAAAAAASTHTHVRTRGEPDCTTLYLQLVKSS